MRTLVAIVALAALAGCAAGSQRSAYGTRSCGLLFCLSSPYLKAKLSPTIIGKPPSAAIDLAGAPTSTYRDANGIDYLTWRRTQAHGDGTLACTETAAVFKGDIIDYRFEGHC